MAAALIGALAPDLDAVARLWDPMAAITVHRTVTHSILGGAIVALVAAGLVWAFSRENFLRLITVAYLGVMSHIGLDLLTPFGTAFLWPLSDRRFSLELHHVIDPIFSALTLGFLIFTFSSKGSRILFARTGLAAIVLYMLAATAHQRIAYSRWQASLGSQGIRPIRSTVIPLFPGPFRWLGVSETKDAFYQQQVWVYGAPPAPPRLFSKAAADPGLIEEEREVQLFLRFARFPWRQVRTEGSFRVVEYHELAFADHPLGGRLSLRLWMDDFGTVRKVEFGHRF